MIAHDHPGVVSVTDYWRMAHLPENWDKRLELVEGAIQEMPPSSTRNTVIAGLFNFFFNLYLQENPIGYASVPDGGYLMANGNVRQPDAAYISKARYPQLRDNVFPVAPEIAVEVISPSESAAHIRAKVRDYLSSGTIYVWAAYPDDETVDVHRLNPDGTILVRKLTHDETLQADDVLPGFALEVKKVFPDEA
jgi:Uma2 family endonuclease